MSGKRTKLKKINLTSVDMVPRGANQEAHINLYKSAGDPEPSSDPPEPQNPDDIPQSLWKSIADAVKRFMNAGQAENGGPEDAGEIEKAAEQFEDRVMLMESRENRWRYQDALNQSIDSILTDNSISADEKINMLHESIDQFAEAYKKMFAELVRATKNNEPAAVGKSQEEIPDYTEKGDKEMKIDKSRFSAEELEQYEALIAKGLVEDDDDTEEKKFPQKKEDDDDVEKSATMHPEVKKALEEMESLKKSIEMKELTDIAKKYSILGKKEDELATTLYDMKKSSPEAYDAYIAVLDENLDLVNKSGVFEEIGKSASGSTGGSVEAKIEGIAKGYQDKDPSMDYDTAVLKAWENHPELMAEYDAEY